MNTVQCVLSFLLLFSILPAVPMCHGDIEESIEFPCFSTKRVAMQCWLRKGMRQQRIERKRNKQKRRYETCCAFNWGLKKLCIRLCECFVLCNCAIEVVEYE